MRQMIERLFRQKTALLLIFTVALLVSVYRDIRNSVAMPADLRNRIIGARMIKDGLSPYFYIWKEGDPVQYYDTYIPPNSPASPVTSTPFFHHVASLIADFPQVKLNTLWFMLEYLCAGLCCLLAAATMPLPQRQKMLWVLAALTIFFTYTIGWRIHISVGQNYIFVPVLIMGCYYCLMQKKDGLHLLLFGLFACSLVLLRPIAALFFVPLLFYVKTYFKWMFSAAVLMVGYVAFVFSSPVQKTNWTDYFKSVKVHTSGHQEQLPPLTYVAYNPEAHHSFEGVNLHSEGSGYWKKKLKKGSENSNFFIFYKVFTGKKISIAAQTVLGLAICFIMLIPLLLMQRRKLPFAVADLMLLGFILYNTYEFFTPVTRIAYHWVQFLFPVLLAPLCMVKRIYLVPALLLLAGVVLNTLVLPRVKMEHNIGEFLFTVGLLLLVYRDWIASIWGDRKLGITETVRVL